MYVFVIFHINLKVTYIIDWYYMSYIHSSVDLLFSQYIIQIDIYCVLIDNIYTSLFKSVFF